MSISELLQHMFKSRSLWYWEGAWVLRSGPMTNKIRARIFSKFFHIPSRFSLSSENIYVKFDGMVYQQKVGISISTNYYQLSLQSYGSWFDLLDVVLTFLIFILKIFKSLQSYWHRNTDITSSEKKNDLEVLHVILENWCDIFFQEESLTQSSPVVILFTN